MKSIMVATDFSPRSDRALRPATILARPSKAALSLVHVVDDDQPQRIVDGDREAATQLLRGHAITHKQEDGTVPERALPKTECNALAMPTKPLSG